VDSHRKNLLAKLNVKNTASLIKFAVENKLI
jgi:DNA-binding CsgD family transcriptional regulator